MDADKGSTNDRAGVMQRTTRIGLNRPLEPLFPAER
jgi:hypothetical protein